jgi:hypothetical protein
VVRTPTVPEIVDHYLAAHKDARTLAEIAEELRQAAGAGSDTSLSAWRKGQRQPPIGAVKALRRIMACQHSEFGDETIGHAFGHAAVASGLLPPRRRSGPGAERAPTPTAPRRSRYIVGRDAELREIAAMGRSNTRHRVLNIFGPGGIGKTEVFNKIVASGGGPDAAMGYADVTDLRYLDPGQSFQPSGILAAFAGTLDRSELEPLRRELDHLKQVHNHLHASGGIDALFGADGRRIDAVALTAITVGATGYLNEIFRDQFTLERYLRQATPTLTHLFCEGIGAVTGAGIRVVLAIDTYEEIAEADRWVLRELVPRLPEPAGLVMFGRNALTKTNMDWLDLQDVVRQHPLLELSQSEALSYLRHYGLTDLQGLYGVYAVTGGYPLLLVLARALAEESGGWTAIGELRRERDRDAIASTLLDRLLREDRMRRIASVITDCAIAPWISPEIISVLMRVAPAESHELYRRLQAHSIVSPHPRGLVLHEKIRELLTARLRFADRGRYDDLRGALAEYFGRQGGRGAGCLTRWSRNNWSILSNISGSCSTARR